MNGSPGSNQATTGNQGMGPGESRFSPARDLVTEQTPTRTAALREKGAAAGEKVRQRVGQARTVASEKAPQVRSAVEERRGLAGAAAAAAIALLLGLVMLRRVRKARSATT